MDQMILDGVILTPLKKICHPLGDVYHGIKKNDTGFNGFSEAYISTIKIGDIKPWKKHLKMTLNIFVPVGEIRFVIYDDRIKSKSFGNFFDITLSLDNYYRLTIPPNLWVAFQGIGEPTNLLINIANLEHDPNEIVRKELQDIKYTLW